VYEQVLKLTSWRVLFKKKRISRATHPTRPWSLFMYHQSTAPVPPPDLPQVVAPVSTEPVSASGLPLVVPAVVRHHVFPTHTAQMALFAQAICIQAQVVQDVGGDHLEKCVYLHEV